MKIKTTEYPRPVLNEYLKDFKNSRFALSDPEFTETAESIVLKISYELVCPGIEDLISQGKAKTVVRLNCPRAFYRTICDLKAGEPTEIVISKSLIADKLEIQGIILATEDFNSYKLPEFNESYFGSMKFSLRKGDVIANEPGMEIKLNKVLEKTAAGVVKITVDSNSESIRVKYATVDEPDSQYSNYIVVVLPQRDFENYKNLTKKKYFKSGVERALQASLLLPVIVEAVDLIKAELLTEPDEDDARYIGTIWADSVIEALAKKDIDPTLTQKTSVELANMILGDVVADSLNDLWEKQKEMTKMQQWEDIL